MAEELPTSPLDVAERAASVLGPESGLLEDLDAAGFGEALARALRAGLARPLVPAGAALRLAGDLARIPGVAATRWWGGAAEPPLALDQSDRRFADPAWSASPGFFAVRQAYLAGCRFAREVVAGVGLDEDTAGKAVMATDLVLDALAPTNFLLTNPAALKRAFDTAGASLARGARNVVEDLVHNGGRPRQVDAAALRVGRDLAVTPAKVVYRNELMEFRTGPAGRMSTPGRCRPHRRWAARPIRCSATAPAPTS
jgi:polyhydroxyalkanoate synthase